MDTLSAHGLRSTSDPSRRGFLISMIGAGVMLGYARRSLADQTTGSASELFEPTIWYGINPSGEVTINITRAEMGQHVGTALARIVADELEADWGKVRDCHSRLRSEMGRNDNGRQLVGLAEFPGAQPSGRRWPHRPDRRRRQTARRQSAKLHGAQRCSARQRRSILYGDIVAHGNLRRTFTPEQLKRNLD